MGLSISVIPDPAASIRAFEGVAALAARRAQSLDENGDPPLAEVDALAEAGLLSLPFSSALGGAGLASGQAATRTLAPALRILGRGSLPLGRLYEGHVNAIRLVETYGSVAQRSRMADEARRGALLAFGLPTRTTTACGFVLREAL